MIPTLLSFKGYLKYDPYDQMSAKKAAWLHLLFTLLFFSLFYYLIEFVFPIISFRNTADKWIFIILFSIFYGLISKIFRKSSSLFLLGILLIPLFIIDLYFEGSFVKTGEEKALWNFQPHTFLSAITNLPLRFLLWNTIVGILLGPISLWISRLLALFFIDKSIPIIPLRSQMDTLFKKEWIADPIPAMPVRKLDFHFLKWVGIVYLFYLIFLWIGWFSSGIYGVTIWSGGIKNLFEGTFHNPIHGLNFMGKMVLMSLLGLIAAYNKPLRWFCVLALFVGHLISTVLIFIFYQKSGNSLDQEMLFTAGIVDAILTIAFFITLIYAKKYRGPSYTRIKGLPTTYSLPYWTITRCFYILSILFLACFVFLLLIRFSEGAGWKLSYKNLLAAPDFIAYNSMTYFGTLSLLAFMAARTESLQNKLFSTIVNPLSFSLFFGLLWFIHGPSFGDTYHPFFLFFFVTLSSIIIILHTLRRLRFNIDYLITAMHPSEALTAESVVQCLYGKEQTDGKSALKKINNYISNIRGRKRGLVNFPFWILENILSPIMGLRPFFSLMDEAERNYFLKRFSLRLPANRKTAWVPVMAELSFKIGTSIKALATFAHFTTEKGKDQVGYIAPENRAGFKDFNHYHPSLVKHQPAKLVPNSYFAIENEFNKDYAKSNKNHKRPRRIFEPKDQYDYIIIGSGAAGAVMAYRLARAVADASSILLVERGKRHSAVNSMNDDELDMLAKLYKEGGLQQTKNFDMVVLQGECLGGTTVINNAVCFKMPDSVETNWEAEFGLDLTGLEAEMNLIAREINIHQLDQTAINQNVLTAFNKGVTAYNAKHQTQTLENIGVVKVNAIDEKGDGLWNLGNKRKRKLSMAQTYIKWAEKLGIHVLENTNAIRFFSETSGPTSSKVKATHLLVQLSNKTFKKIRITKKLIIAGGCLASSHFLMRSKVTKNVGKQLSCNYAFPFAFEFEDAMNAFDGAQITAAAIDKVSTPKDLIFETYFNPPAAFALTLPFHFKTVQNVMNNYCHYLNLGVLIGSENTGEMLSKPNPLDGRAFIWKLSENDILAIKKAFKIIVEIGLLAGAKKVIIPLTPGVQIDLTKPNAFSEFERLIMDFLLIREDIILNTSHPQGGNLMAGEKQKTQRAVDENFKVEGHENVYVVDASIFPTSIGVNPQWTVMGMSSLASKEVLKAE